MNQIPNVSSIYRELSNISGSNNNYKKQFKYDSPNQLMTNPFEVSS
jgi:hypothetical protein